MSELRLLENFVAVYRARSFRSAAARLDIAQSSVTKRIQLLEKELNIRLFNRTTRAVEPTDGARQLIAHAEHALQSASVFDEEARLIAGGELGSIRVGAIALAAETRVVDALARLAQTHPSLEVEVIVGGADIYRDLATGSCDVVVGDGANFSSSDYAPTLRMQPISEEPLVFVHRRGHPASGAPDLATLLTYPLAIPSRYFSENQLFTALASRANPATAPRYRLNSLSACLSLVASTDAVSLAPESLVARFTSPGQRDAIEAAQFSTGIDFGMVLVTAVRNAPTPAVRAFVDAFVGL